ncbi:hypothetical protein PRIPAC_94729 [Pristionchus pacificus]|nr:hypothetical protein PRIPAC_94729 [Pristionchus pacificus]
MRDRLVFLSCLEGRMPDPHVDQDPTSISILVENWADDQVEQFSSIYRINGYPWRLGIIRSGEDTRNVYLVCDKSCESELWQCTATIMSPDVNVLPITQIFTSWDKNSQRRYLGWMPHVNGQMLHINVTIKNEGNNWRIRPTLVAFDSIIVVGEDEEIIPVNKESLASQSSFFDKLFNGDFKENNMNAIFVEDVEYEDLSNMIEMVYGSDGPSLTDENVYTFLELADRFDFKIVEDRVISFLLSPYSSLSIHRKLLISDQFNLPFLKDNVLKRYSKAQMIDLIESAEFDQISHDYLQVLFNKYSMDAFQLYRTSRMNWQTSQIPVSSTPFDRNESNRISMIVKDFDCGDIEQFSSIHRINGFPWRLSIMKSPSFKDSFNNSMELEDTYYSADVHLICDKSDEAELWKCTATISSSFYRYESKLFASWDKDSHVILADCQINVGSVVEVYIATDDDGERYCDFPSLDPLESHDGILFFENTEKKIKVNKESLASQSPYFDSLFFGNSKEKDRRKRRKHKRDKEKKNEEKNKKEKRRKMEKDEFPVGDVDYEEFSTIMALLYGDDDNATVNCNSAERLLQLAARFDLRLVEDRVVPFLISPSSSDISLPKKLRISDQYDLPLLKEFLLISEFHSIDQLKELSESPQWNQLSKEMLRILFKKFCI